MSKTSITVLLLLLGVGSVLLCSWWYANSRPLKQTFEQRERIESLFPSTWQPPKKTPLAAGVTWEFELELPPQPDGLSDICFSPDGSKLITICKNDTAQIWDVAAQDMLKELPARGQMTRAVGHFFYRPVFSPDGTKLIVQGMPTEIYHWPSLELDNRYEFDGAFYFEGKLLLIKNPELRSGGGLAFGPTIWDPITMKEYVRPDFDDEQNSTDFYYYFKSQIPSKVWGEARMPSPDGSQYLEWQPNYKSSGAADPIGPIVRVYDAGDRSLISALESDGELRAVAWSPDGQRIATGCSDGIARVWRLVLVGK